MKRTSLYSELNLLSHYAPTRRVTITVQDENGFPVKAQVKFKLYNYAEYYTLATMTTDTGGKASLTTGLGDLLIWVTDGDHYTFEKLDVREDSTMTITLNTEHLTLNTFEIVPPVAGEPKVVATEEEIAANTKRLAYEDSLRNAYTTTFPSKESLQRIEGIQYINQEQLWELVHKSEGNYKTILNFIMKHGWHEEEFGDVYDYLKSYSDKDLRDITAATLEAHWSTPEAYQNIDISTYQHGLMPARISNEMVRPYREELAEFKDMKYADYIFQWVSGHIVVDDSSNYYNCPISPVGVYKLRRADRHSRDIFFVAACRAAGIPAYLDNATNTIYAADASKSVFRKMDFNDDNHPVYINAKRAKLTLTYRGNEPAKPIYWPHFTLAKLENGDLRTFDFEDDPRMANFPATIELGPGTYCLSTGNRYPDGTVRSRMEFFEMKSGENVTKEIIILPLEDKLNTKHLTLNTHLELFDGIELWDYAGDAGMLYVNLGNYSEPSKHLVVELKLMQKEMKAWGGMTFMVGPTTIGMPSWGLVNTDFAYNKGLLEQRILEATKSSDNVQYPLVALIDKEGHILYHSTGYKIGVIEQVLKAAK